MQNALAFFAAVSFFSPSSLEMMELPPSPKISPKAIISVNTGTARETPATRYCLPVSAIKNIHNPELDYGCPTVAQNLAPYHM